SRRGPWGPARGEVGWSGPRRPTHPGRRRRGTWRSSVRVARLDWVPHSSCVQPTVPSRPAVRDVFITGGTGYMGRRLIERLLGRGHRVCALARPGSEGRVPSGAAIATGDALHGLSYAAKVSPADTFIHLVGVPH